MRHSVFASLALLLPFANANSEDLLVGNIAARVHAIVYELPGVPSGQARMIIGLMKQKFPQAEVIDAAVGENELRAKLQKSFLLLTTLDGTSRLLPLVAQPLGVKLENGALHWDDFVAPAKDMRVDFVGRNPYGAGYSLVVAVGSPALLQGGGDGQYSYAIRNSESLLRRGIYDAEFTPIDRSRLKLADARADVGEFFSTLERIHADPFARVTEQDYRRMKDQTFADLEARAGKDGLVRTEDLAYLLRYSAAFIRDGHTEMGWGVSSVYQEPLDNRRFPPFRLEFENGRFFITGSNDATLVGQELVSVNGAPTGEFLRPALDRIAGEILTWRATRFADNQDFWYWFTNLVGKTQRCCKLQLRDATGAETDRAVDSVTLAQFGKIQATSRRKLPPRAGTQVHFFDSRKVAQFSYPAFGYSEAEAAKVADIFHQIREAKSEDVIVDLRGNGGGQIFMGSLIFSYLSPKPVEQFKGGRMRISTEAYADIFGELASSQAGGLLTISDTDTLAKQLAGQFAAVNQLPKREPFAGRVWLLVDHRTFSAANIFSVAFQKSRIGTILGYETGQPAEICGDPVIHFNLKHSGISYRVSASATFTSKLPPGAAEHGVLPDVFFDRKMLAPFHNEPDPELAFTLDYIAKHR
jgi:hypothetical protein